MKDEINYENGVPVSELKKLYMPFPAEDIEWRVCRSGLKKDGQPWAMVLAYITNRAVMDILDHVCKPWNWRNEYKPLPDGGMICGVSIRINGEWITKWDGADKTNIEATKGGLSGAMKRAVVQWGVGRYLYKLSETFALISPNGKNNAKAEDKQTRQTVWFKWDEPQLPTWALPKQKKEKENATTK